MKAHAQQQPPSGTVSPPGGRHNNRKWLSHPQYSGNWRGDRSRCSRSNNRPHPRDRSTSRSRHASRDRNPRWRHTPNSNWAQSRSPHRQRSGSNRPLTPYPRNNSRSRSSSHGSETSPRHSVTIKDNYEDYGDQDYNNTDDYYDEDLN